MAVVPGATGSRCSQPLSVKEAHGAGPALLPAAVARFLEHEQRAGTVAADAPIDGVAASIAGACYLRAFLEQFYGPDHPQQPMTEFAASIMATVLPALTTHPAASTPSD
ncbi:hypothetical protein SAMN04490240_3323 [Rhodococcus pyridinivorans]|nr:hypothetical protein SAMN04490240_3323 [Rhodococcus pyridinivorans]